MIGKGKSISHGTAALEYDLAKEIDGQTAAIEIARHELYGCTGAEMVQEMKPYHACGRVWKRPEQRGYRVLREDPF